MSNTNQPNKVCQRGVDGSPGCGHEKQYFINGYCNKVVDDPAGGDGRQLCCHHCSDFSVRVPERLIVNCQGCGKYHEPPLCEAGRPRVPEFGDAEREELDQLRREMESASLGDRPHNIGASKLRRLIELESAERAGVPDERHEFVDEKCEHGVPLNEACEPCKHPAWGQPRDAACHAVENVAVFDDRTVDPRLIPEKWLYDVRFFDHIQGVSGVCTWQCDVCFQRWDSGAKLPCPRCRPNWKDELATIHLVEPPKECDSCHHSGPRNDAGTCLVDIRHLVDPEGPFRGQTMCGCQCTFPTSSTQPDAANDDDSENVSCPFCSDAGYDLLGLASHLIHDCEPFNNIERLQRL